MNPMQSIATALTGRSPWPFQMPAKPEPKPTSKTDKLRHHLRAQGSANAVVLAMEADLDNTGLVSALLAGDIEKGRVFMRAGKYHWNPQHDEQLQAQLKAAANLLKRHGYKVSKT
jgi:hypothetical protein